MPDERKRHLMQEALDEALSPDQQRELSLYMDEEPDEMNHYNRLQQVDSILQTAPFERAPRRLAMTIMARLASTVKQQELESEDLHSPQLAEATLQVAVQLVTVATMPMLIGASYMMLNAMSDPAVLERVLQRVAALYILVIDVMKIMIEEAQEQYEEDPQAAMAMLALMPVTLLKLVEIVLGYEDDEA